MKLFAPKYYKNFKCIADKCTHSCCTGWEIDIDTSTLEKYNKLTDGYAEKIKSSISGEGVAHFELCKGNRCPHLDKNGLCKIITELGEDYLCDICREHPRFYHDTPYGKEVGLGISCEEACRVILSSDEYADFTVTGELEGDISDFGFDAVAERKRIYATLLNDLPLDKIASKYGVSLDIHTDTEWREVFSGLEYLDDAHRELFSRFTSNPQPAKPLEPMLKRFFAYFVFRHCSKATNEGELTAALGFALLCTTLLASLSTTESVYDMARIISEELEYSEDNTESLKLEFI